MAETVQEVSFCDHLNGFKRNTPRILHGLLIRRHVKSADSIDTERA